MPKTKTRQVGRDSLTGKFIPKEEAKRKRATATVETIPIPPKPKRKSK